MFSLITLVGCDLSEPDWMCGGEGYTIRLTVRGVDHSDGDIYTFLVTGSTDFALETQAAWIDDALTASIEMSASIKNESLLLIIQNSTEGRMLYSHCLPKLIKDAYESSGQTVDFAKTHNFDIALAFDPAFGLEVTVNGWQYYITSTQLQ